jgi:16S rRNA (guanine1516-N2)-methyltransferase
MAHNNKKRETDDLICDFVGGAVGHRYRFGGGRGQALPKAIGMKGRGTIRVVDATAGLGRDAFLLASIGAEVTLIERSKVMHKKLAMGLARAKASGGDIADIIDRMTLIHGCSIDLIPGLAPEIILIDPMHPPRQNSALVKKEMRQIREIVGTDEDSVRLMEVALVSASKRVVLKWPKSSAPMDGIRPPSHQIIGKSTRYDVWMMG